MLRQMEFVERLLQDGFRDAGGVFGGGLKKAGRGEIIDLPWDATAVVVNHSLGGFLEELLRSSGLLELEIDVGGGLFAGEGGQMVSDGDAVEKGRMDGLTQDLAKRFLAGQYHFQWGSIVEGGADQQANVGEGIGMEEMSLVDDQYQGAFGLTRFFQDLFEQPFFAASRNFT